MSLRFLNSRDLLNAACGMSSFPTIIDIRSESDFSASHIGASASLDLSSTLKTTEAVSEKIGGNSRTKTLSSSSLAIFVSDEEGFDYFPIINELYSSTPIYSNVYFLKDTYEQFKLQYSHVCSDEKLLKNRVQLSSVPCEIIPGLFLGQMVNTSNAEIIFDALGITHILNCTLEGEVIYKVAPHIEMKQILIDDEKANEYPLDEGLEFLKRVVIDSSSSSSSSSTRKRCFVHCSMGISRSATIVIAFLMWKYGLTVHDALLVTRTERRPVFPNPGFTHQLLMFEQRLRNEGRIAKGAEKAQFDLKHFTSLPPAEVDKIVELGVNWKQG